MAPPAVRPRRPEADHASDRVDNAAGTADAGVAPAATAADPTPAPETASGGVRGAAGDAETAPTRRALAARLCQQRVLGMLEPRLAGELRLELRRRYPRLDAAETAATAGEATDGAPLEDRPEGLPAVLTPTGDRLEELAADSAFATILELPPADQRCARVGGDQRALGQTTARRRERVRARQRRPIELRVLVRER